MAWVGAEMRVCAKGYKVLFGVMEIILRLDYDAEYTDQHHWYYTLKGKLLSINCIAMYCQH